MIYRLFLFIIYIIHPLRSLKQSYYLPSTYLWALVFNISDRVKIKIENGEVLTERELIIAEYGMTSHS